MTGMQVTNSLEISHAVNRTADSIPPKRHTSLTPYQVLRSLPSGATPAQQDSAIRANFTPVVVAPSSRPDTLYIPGLKAEPFGVNVDAKAYQKGFFNNRPHFHPELRIVQPGIAGDPIPYQLHRDDYVTGALLLSFFLVVWTISCSRHILAQQIKDFFQTRERGNLFTLGTDSELRGQLFLIFQTCVVLGVLFFDYTQEYLPDVFHEVSPYKLLGINIGICLAFYTVKVLTYLFVNWIFFDKRRNEQWLESYFLIILGIGVTLFPIALLTVYFNLSPAMLQITFTTILIVAKILLFYKCKTIFFSHFYGYLQLIVYFCTLEMIPAFVLWRTLVRINQSLVVIF